MSLRQALTLTILQTEISASPFADAETWQRSDQRDQNENKNDYEFDYGENVLNAVMPRHSDRVPIGNTTRNYARFTLHGSPMWPDRSEARHGTLVRKASPYVTRFIF